MFLDFVLSMKRLLTKNRCWLLIGAVHLWWLVLSGRFLWSFWTNDAIGGADGSGHVAALHLYALHVYPDIQGWLPEFFGGMPFPIYYPPLFYWCVALLQRTHLFSFTTGFKLVLTLPVLLMPAAVCCWAGICRTRAVWLPLRHRWRVWSC